MMADRSMQHIVNILDIMQRWLYLASI